MDFVIFNVVNLLLIAINAILCNIKMIKCKQYCKDNAQLVLKDWYLLLLDA